MNNRISVIIPCYNGKKYIAETLKTVEAEGDIIGEIIVVDDASTDGSAQYVEALGTPGLKLFRLPKNLGISGARNAAIKQAAFSLIALLDADDLWTKGRSRLLLDAMEANNAPWAFGEIEHFISEDCVDGAKYVLPPTQVGYFASAMLVRSEFLKAAGPFNESLKVGEFIDWYDRARLLHASPALVKSVVLKRRIHGANTSIMADKKNALDYLKVARAAIERKKQAEQKS